MTILELARQLIAFPSTSGDELPLARYVASLLGGRGIPCVLDDYPSRGKTTANVYASCGRGENILMLYAHSDVVPAPAGLFAPRVDGGRLHGRGATDMKSALAGLLQVLLEDHAQLKELPYRLLFTFIAEEETTAGGIQQFVRWLRPQPYRSLACILMEPTDDFTAMNVGGKGYAFLDLEGTNQDVLASFRAIHRHKPGLLARYPDRQDGFAGPTLELTKITPQRALAGEVVHGRASHASRPQFGENAIEKALAAGGDITGLHSSDTEGPNSLPSSVVLVRNDHRCDLESCRAHIDLRTNLEADADDGLLASVRGLVHPRVRVSLRDRGRAFRTDDGRLIALCHGAKGDAVEERISSGGSDAPYLLPLTGSIIAGFGPGRCSLSHTDQECVDLAVLEETPRIIRRIIQGFRV